MTFETLDYVAEAERIHLAFDVKGDCEFIVTNGYTMTLQQHNLHYVVLNEHDAPVLYCTYEKAAGREFAIYSNQENAITAFTQLTVDWNNDIPVETIRDVSDFSYNVVLAKGLFHLGLLTTKAEAAMRVSIAAHQKLEWILEYQRRVGQD